MKVDLLLQICIPTIPCLMENESSDSKTSQAKIWFSSAMILLVGVICLFLSHLLWPGEYDALIGQGEVIFPESVAVARKTMMLKSRACS